MEKVDISSRSRSRSLRGSGLARNLSGFASTLGEHYAQFQLNRQREDEGEDEAKTRLGF